MVEFWQLWAKTTPSSYFSEQLCYEDKMVAEEKQFAARVGYNCNKSINIEN